MCTVLLIDERRRGLNLAPDAGARRSPRLEGAAPCTDVRSSAVQPNILAGAYTHVPLPSHGPDSRCVNQVN